MKNIVQIVAITALSLASVSQGDLIGDSNTTRLLDGPGSGNWDGMGDTTAVHILNVGTKSTSTGYNVHSGIAFQMTGASSSNDLTAADFSIGYTGTTGDPSAWNVDAYVTRVASSSAFLASDYENGTLLMEDFVTTSSAIGNYSLDTTGEVNLLTYLQSNWVQNEYVFITLKSNVAGFDIGADANDSYNFGGSITTWTAGGSDAQLSITAVPEPSSMALLGMGAALLAAARRRKTRA